MKQDKIKRIWEAHLDEALTKAGNVKAFVKNSHIKDFDTFLLEVFCR